MPISLRSLLLTSVALLAAVEAHAQGRTLEAATTVSSTTPTAQQPVQSPDPAPVGDRAQEERDTAGSEGSSLDVVVTARRREESLLSVPQAVTALSADQIEARQIRTLNDVARFTPGLAINNTAAQRNDRSSQTVLVRGIVPNAGAAATAAGVFIDGVPVIGGFVEGITDLERVEVLKGPQSAYFGRAVFAGAINLVTRTPSDELRATAQLSYGTRNYTDDRFSLEGPIITDLLSARVSARYFFTEGSFRNNSPDGGRLGDQKTFSLSTLLYATPASNLTAKLYYLAWRDDDGPVSSAVYNRALYNCNAGGAAAGTLNYVCGRLPTLPSSSFAVNVPQSTIDFIIRDPLDRFNPIFNSINDDAGLARRAMHLHFDLNWQIPGTGVTLSSLTGRNFQKIQNMQNSIQQDVSTLPNPNFGRIVGAPPFPQQLLALQNRLQDISQEFRLTTDPAKPFKILFGASYLFTKSESIIFGVTAAGPATFNDNAPRRTNTYGLFGSVSYDLTSQLTVSAEGRYQIDKIRANRRVGTLIFETEFRDFIPRASVQFEPNEDNLFYATYSVGVNPGTFNVGLLGFPQTTLDLVAAQTGAGLTVTPEKLYNHEVGYKGRFLNGRAQVTLAAYYAKWRDQIVSDRIVVPLPTNPNITTVLLPLTNTGRTNLTGVEVELFLRPDPRFTLGATFAYNKSDIRSVVCTICTTITGKTNFTGNRLAGVPEYNGSLSAEWRDRLSASTEYYGRTDFSFSGSRVDLPTEVTSTQPPRVVDVRAGIRRGSLEVEAFATNLLNNRAPTSITSSTDAARANALTVFTGLPVLRQVGVRTRVVF